jgi:membrane complex biogenesis BtpA family protein
MSLPAPAAAARPAPPRLNGMVHLRPLPGSPRAESMDEALRAALADARALLSAGFDGLVVENWGDAPFHPGAVPAVTVAAMTRIAAALVELAGPRARVAVNVLRNDARAALAVAAAAGAKAIRVNVHAGARLTDQGLVEGRAWETLRLRSAWSAPAVAVWADAAVKHSAALGEPRPLSDEVEELVLRGGVDAVLVTGSATGKAPARERLAEVLAAAHGRPVLVASGVDSSSVFEYLRAGPAGVIVGTALKEAGRVDSPVDPARAADFVRAAGG